MSDAPKPAKPKSTGRPKKTALAPSKKERLIASGKYEEYKAKARERDRAKGRQYRANTKKKAGLLTEEQAEAFVSPDPEVREALAEELEQEKLRISVQEAARVEMARREMARRKIIHYTVRNLPHYRAGWVHIEIAEKLEKFVADVAAGKRPRLAIFMPPRHGKTELMKQLISWTLGHHPHMEIIGCSYAASLQEEISRRVQETIRSKEYQALFPGITIDKRSESVSDWRIARHGGGMLAVGVGGPITGRGAHILYIDDPVKNREEADSEIIRASTWNWYTSTAYTRLAPGAGVLIIQTRWHDDDLSGRVLQSIADARKQEAETGVWPSDVDKWEIIEYPAIATSDEPHRLMGQALHPDRYSITDLAKIRRTIGPRDWAALYQQNPVADEGAYFKKDMIQYYDNLPEYLNYYTTADLAISKKESADYSVILTAGVDHLDNLYVVDLMRGRWDSAEIIDRLVQTYRDWRPKSMGIEAGQIEKAIGPFLNKRIAEERLYGMYVEPLPPGKRDKELRARPIQGRMGQKRVFLPRTAPWIEALVHEMLRFPTGVHDDQVDALAWIGQMLENLRGAALPSAPKKKSWKDDLHKYVAGVSDGYNPMAA